MIVTCTGFLKQYRYLRECLISSKALNLAGDFSLRREPRGAIIVGQLPESVFSRLKAVGQVQTTPLLGTDYDQTIFLPGAFPTINSYNLRKWDIIPYGN